MSDQITPENNDQTDDVSAEEAEQAKTVDVRSLGIEPLSTPIPTIAKVYRSFVTKVQTFNENRKKEKADPKDPVVIVQNRITESAKSDNESLKAIVSSTQNIALQVRDLLFSELDKSNGMLAAHVMVQEMKALLSDVQDNSDYYFNKAVQVEKDRQGIVVTPSEEAVADKLTAIKLRSLIENRVNIAEAMGDELPDNLFKISDAGRKGFNTDVVPRLPKLDMGDAAPKSYSTLRLAFRFQENGATDEQILNVDESYTLNDVAHNVVSRGGYRITGETIAARLKKEGYGIGATDDEWSLVFKTGTLFGKKVSA